MKNCSIEKLIKRTNDTNAIIRSYMFLGLARKNIDMNTLSTILDSHIDDTITFRKKSIDMITSWTIKEFMQMCFKSKSSDLLVQVDCDKEIKGIREDANFRIKINGAHHGLIKKEDLIKIDSLIFPIKDFLVLSFTLYIGKSPIFKAFSGVSKIFSNEIKKAIINLEPGDYLTFDDIKVVGSDGRTRTIPPIALIVE